MIRKHLEMPDKQLQLTARQRLLRAAFFCSLALVVGGWLWFYLGMVELVISPSLWWGGLWVVLLFLAALLGFGLDAAAALDEVWRYRLVFLLGSSLPFIFWILRRLTGLGAPALTWSNCILSILISPLAAFLGGLLASSIFEGVWEDNSPPPDLIQEDVFHMHEQFGGTPIRLDKAKRLFDIIMASFGLVLAAPMGLFSAFLIWFEDPGPLLFVKNSVGRGGRNFHQFKFRTMVRGAEEHTGPVMAQEGDERVLFFGRFLRKTALDELPQLINILRGEMSFVGPRPQRTVLVHDYLHEMPEYAERHRVLPGLSGLAQVAGDYYLTPRQKLRFDRLYIRHASLGFDLKLLLLAFLITFWLRWHSKWDGRLPRRLLRLGSSSQPGGKRLFKTTPPQQRPG